MNTATINLNDFYDLKGGTLSATYMDNPWDNKSTPFIRPAVIIVPGGAYWMVSVREAEPIGNYFMYAGFQVFILNYLCARDNIGYPEQLYELASAVDYVKKNAEKFRVDPNKVFCVGSSAGGHLTANLAVEYQKADKELGIDSKPAGVCLSYPVISASCGHVDTFNNLLNIYGEEEKQELIKHLSLEKLVTPSTPPCFIWTTAKDDYVPAVNSLIFATALSNNKVDFELHVYPEGHHGTSSCSTEINAFKPFLKKNSQWLSDCADFFKLIIEKAKTTL